MLLPYGFEVTLGLLTIPNPQSPIPNPQSIGGRTSVSVAVTAGVAVVVIIVVAFASDIYVVEHDAENARADPGKLPSRATRQFPRAPARLNHEDQAIDHGGKNDRIGDAHHWRRIDQNVIVLLAERAEQFLHAVGAD